MFERSFVYPQASALRPQTQGASDPISTTTGTCPPPHPPHRVMMEIVISNVLASTLQRFAPLGSKDTKVRGGKKRRSPPPTTHTTVQLSGKVAKVACQTRTLGVVDMTSAHANAHTRARVASLPPRPTRVLATKRFQRDTKDVDCRNPDPDRCPHERAKCCIARPPFRAEKLARSASELQRHSSTCGRVAMT